MSLNSHGNALPQGFRLHWYRLESVLGQGGFGITYLAHDTNLDKAVAIKEYLPVELAVRKDDSTVRPVSEDRRDQFAWGLGRFIEEARTLANFNHPNIVRVHSVFEDNATAYMVMNYEVGESLEDRAKFGRVGSEAELFALIGPLLDALEHMHAAGFIHRDVKPANIVVREGGDPVLLDFGSARLALGGETRTLTSVVSAGYAPYEQYQSDGGKQGPWTDIYGLGATLYSVINRGRGPLDAIVRGNARIEGTPDPMEPATALGAGRYSPALLAAIDAALAFRPAERPQDAAAFRSLLPTDTGAVDSDGATARAEAVTGVAPSPSRTAVTRAAATPSSPPTSIPPGAAPRQSTLRWGLAFGVLALAGAAAWYGFGQGMSEPPPAGARSSSVESGNQTGIPETDAEEEARIAAQRRAGEEVRIAAQRRAEEEARIAAQRRAEEEARIAAQRRAEEEARIAAQRRAGEEARVAAQRRAEEEARIAAQRRSEEENARAAAAGRDAEEAERARGERIASLLSGADADRKALRLSSPEGANAVEKYRAVLALAPDSAEAQAGLIAVVDRYVELAAAATAAGDFDKAAGYLDRADTVVPEAENVVIARDALATEREQSVRLAEETRLAEEKRAAEAEREAEARKAAAREAAARASSPGTVFRDRLADGSEGPAMVVVPAGAFRMGDLRGGGAPDELPIHRVRIARPFAIGRTEVSFDDYDRFVRDAGRASPGDAGFGRGRRPVINVSWRDARAYAQWLSTQTNRRYRLPSEAEWEYAARAGTVTARFWSDNPAESCRFANVYDLTSKSANAFAWNHHDCDDGEAKSAPGGGYVANAFGLFDMLGNVREWTADCYIASYAGAPVDGSARVDDRCDRRVGRGGSWDVKPWYIRSANRYRLPMDFQHVNLGFRLAQDL